MRPTLLAFSIAVAATAIARAEPVSTDNAAGGWVCPSYGDPPVCTRAPERAGADALLLCCELEGDGMSWLRRRWIERCGPGCIEFWERGSADERHETERPAAAVCSDKKATAVCDWSEEHRSWDAEDSGRTTWQTAALRDCARTPSDPPSLFRCTGDLSADLQRDAPRAKVRQGKSKVELVPLPSRAWPDPVRLRRSMRHPEAWVRLGAYQAALDNRLGPFLTATDLGDGCRRIVSLVGSDGCAARPIDVCRRLAHEGPNGKRFEFTHAPLGERVTSTGSGPPACERVYGAPQLPCEFEPACSSGPACRAPPAWRCEPIFADGCARRVAWSCTATGPDGSSSHVLAESTGDASAGAATSR